MVLTPEQQERIRLNRERALELRGRRGEKESKQNLALQEELKRKAQDDKPEPVSKRQKALEGETEMLEDFEENASEFVTKTEAMKMYCLPEGTLAVCKFVEKENPHHKGWAPMKMYDRAEIRKRARQRYGGLDGLIAERKRREEKRFAKDLQKAGSLFT